MKKHILLMTAGAAALGLSLSCAASETIFPGIQQELIEASTESADDDPEETEEENGEALLQEFESYELSSEEASTEAAAGLIVLTEGIEPAAPGAWEDFTLKIDGKDYRFPMMFNDFTKTGWSWTEDDEQVLAPDDYTTWYFGMDDREVFSYIVNPSFDSRSVSECVVSGIHIDPFDWLPEDGTVTLAAGIRRGISDIDDVVNAYGYPSYDPYQRDSMIMLRYESEEHDMLELTFDADTKLLEGISLYCTHAPANFDPGKVNTAKPERAAAYRKPDKLSDDLSDNQVRIGDKVYQIPVPVFSLTDDGWTLTDAEEFVRGRSGSTFTLEKDGTVLTCPAYNFEDTAVIPENCWITEIDLGKLTGGPEGELAGGVQTDMYWYDLEQLLTAAGIDYDYEEDGAYVYFRYNQEDDGSGCEAVVYNGEDGLYDINTVIKISCCRMTLP